MHVCTCSPSHTHTHTRTRINTDGESLEKGPAEAILKSGFIKKRVNAQHEVHTLTQTHTHTHTYAYIPSLRLKRRKCSYCARV